MTDVPSLSLNVTNIELMAVTLLGEQVYRKIRK